MCEFCEQYEFLKKEAKERKKKMTSIHTLESGCLNTL